ncbi:adhesion G protein-coupled receptor E1-like [Octopus vulgaris]|uniref:Adhesion G protein-coupled receptor E1-like n=1 Tax=Octopus vulgaris TaxID=6645 RepID=A0AA36F474_OCTVU|nr:adhesion G protein-coupled receptor E1-like [Octopus vulgaris]
MNHRITRQLVYSSLYLLSVYTVATIAVQDIYGVTPNARIYRRAMAGVFVRKVVGYNNDTKEKAVSYQLFTQGELIYFMINKHSGEISTMTAIDKPVGHQFALNIRAAFKGNTFRDRQLLVDVVENNKEAPQFSKSLYYFLVFQFEKPGKTIGYLNATDESKEDYNRQITYEIQEQKYPILSLDKHSGRLRLNDTLRLDLKDINITVKVSDNGLPSKTAYALVKIKIVGLPELETFCTITKGKTSQICWQNPVHKLNYTYNIEIRNEKYHHRNTVSGGTEHCYNTPLRDSANDSYFYRVQSKFFSEISPYSQWRRAVHMRPDCDKFDQCLIRSPCAHGGTCVSKANNFTCHCTRGWRGETCENEDTCAHKVCLNNGTCKMTSHNEFKCKCPDGYVGNLCQKKLSVCVRLKPCNNRSVCTPTPSGGFICNCKPQFSGENCTEEVTCPEELQTDKSGKYNWPETTFNNTVDLPCSNDPADSQMTASRQCYFNTTLGKVVWLDMNTTLCLEIGREKASETLQGLQAIAEDPSALTADQVANLTEDLENIFTYSLEDVEMAATMTDVISNMLEVNATVLTSSNKRNKTSDRLRHLLEDYTAKAIVPKASIINISSSNINMMVRNISVLHGNLDSNQTYDYDPYFDQGTQAMPDNNMLKFRIPLSVLQPTDNVTKITNERVQLIAYNNAKFFMVENQAQLDYLDKQKVIYVKIKDRQLKNLTTPVSYMMSNVEPGKNNTCVFWNTLNSTWSTEGLTTKYIDPNITLCESTHLTSFSVLLNTSPGELSEIHQKILSYISYIGCIISIVGILLTIITYGLFGCLHGDHSGKILLNLCTSMLLLNSVFLVTSQVDSMKTEESAEALCFNLTILSHLFLLTTLAWMCVEAFNMYQLLVTVFSIYHSHFMLKRMFVAWGFPALIVAITLAVDLKNYKTPPEYCFLSHGNRTAFYAALLAPACIILSINSLVFAMVTKVIMKPKFKNKNQCNSPVTMVQVRGCFTVMVLLGVTWLFGPLAVNEIKLVFNYLFCILNSLQGFFIFVFRCLLNPEAKMAWIQLIKMGTLKKKKGPRKSVDSSSNGMYGGPLANRWSQKTMTIDIRESANLKRSVRSSNGSVIKNNPAKKYGSGDWEDKNGDAYQ